MRLSRSKQWLDDGETCCTGFVQAATQGTDGCIYLVVITLTGGSVGT